MTRNRWWRSTTVILIATLATTALCATPATSDRGNVIRPQLRPPALGVQFHGTWNMYYAEPAGTAPNAMFYQHLDALAALDVSVVRVDVGWSTSQPTPDPPNLSNYYNTRIATTLREAAARGMQTLVTIHQTPAWARANSSGDNKQYPTDPATITPWATWLANTFGPQVLAWEAWNEPNLAGFSGVADRKERAERYVPVLAAIATGIRAGDAEATVVLGGPVYSDDEFVKQLYVAGAQPHFDVMAIHPYQGDQTVAPDTDGDGKGRLVNFTKVIDVMSEYGDLNKPIWWTEVGFSVHDNADIPKDKTWLKGVPDTATSADYLRKTFEIARTRFSGVRLVIVYTAYKPSSDPYGHQTGYRMLEANGDTLPQLPALTSYLNEFEAPRPLR